MHVMATRPCKDMAVLTRDPAEIIRALLPHDRRVLLYGPPGVGKSTLAGHLANTLGAAGRRCWCISADPGSPAFGIPGAVSLAKWEAEEWRVVAFEALCTLDAGRFRLPLVSAVRRLAEEAGNGVVLIDGPGVVRGVAGRELLPGFVEACGVDAVLAISAAGRQPPLMDELHALVAEVCVVRAAEEARRPGKRIRARIRTGKWNTYLAGAVEHTIDLARVNLIGTPPPVEEAGVWTGRQLALLQRKRTLAMGEVLCLEENRLTFKTPIKTIRADAVLIRDAARTADGMIETAAPYAAERFAFVPPPDIAPTVEGNGGPRIVGRVGAVDVALLNGVFGDPLLHLRVRHQRRSLLFDLGESGRLPARIAHQVTDVFITHAHMDHIGGFQWLLRSRLGEFPPCRLYGPPGLAQHIAGFIQSFLWDRIGERGPCFEVGELHADCLQRFRLQAGRSGCETLEAAALPDGILLNEAGFRVRAILLDHHTPVVAYAFEPDKEINVRKDRLTARRLEPGPWLSELKRQLLAENETAMIQLPDGSEASAAALGAELVLISPGKKLVYATDLADTSDNRKRLVTFARNAHTFFCEAPFIEADADHARRNAHLTTRACGEIATAASVARLVPFHFSRRYADKPQQIYEELKAACRQVVVPPSMSVFEAATVPASAEERVLKLDIKTD